MKNYQKCLDKKIFLSKYNYQKNHDSFDLQSYIKRGYNQIKDSLEQRNVDFIFYIHPFNNKIDGDDLIISNVKKLKNINILDNNFINLSNKNINLEFIDNFHTRDSNIMANKIFNDILLLVICYLEAVVMIIYLYLLVIIICWK